MQDMLKKMKKKEGSMSPHEKNAKMSVLSHLRDMAQEAMGGKLKGVKKVSVMSDSPEGLQHGLEAAHEMVEHKDEMSPDHMETEPHEESEDPYENLEDEQEEKAPHEMSHSELADHISKLQELHKSMRKG